MDNIPHIIEVALFLLVAFLLGCIIGWLLRKAFSRSPTVTAATSAPPTAKSAPALKAKPAAVETVPAESARNGDQTEADKAARPQGLEAPRDGKKDDLKKIKGVGPKLETVLNELGIYHFDQIAAWDRAAIDWVDDYLSFKGRIDRDGWVEQARVLPG